MKITELCKMIEDSLHSGKYPLEQHQKNFINWIEVINRSDSDDLKSNEIKIEVRLRNLYTINNYISNISHLPGIIEMDILDSVRMLCRRQERAALETQTESYEKIEISKLREHLDESG